MQSGWSKVDGTGTGGGGEGGGDPVDNSTVGDQGDGRGEHELGTGNLYGSGTGTSGKQNGYTSPTGHIGNSSQGGGGEGTNDELGHKTSNPLSTSEHLQHITSHPHRTGTSLNLFNCLRHRRGLRNGSSGDGEGGTDLGASGGEGHDGGVNGGGTASLTRT